MLVLSRKIQEQVLFPSLNIKITVLSVGKNRVQLGIEAPLAIDVTRPEASVAAWPELSRAEDSGPFEVSDGLEGCRGTASLQACQ